VRPDERRAALRWSVMRGELYGVRPTVSVVDVADLVDNRARPM
jgi:hypothetical protein